MKLTINTVQYSQLMVCLFYDQLLHPDKSIPILEDQDYNDLLSIMKHRGVLTLFQLYYMRLDPQMRMRFRLIREAFRNNNNMKDLILEVKKDTISVPKKGIVRRTGEFVQKILGIGGKG